MQLWYLGNGENVEPIEINAKLPSDKPLKLYSAQFQKNHYDLIIVGGTGSNEVKLLDSESSLFEPFYRIYNLSRASFTCDFANSGEMFAIGGGDGVVRCFDVTKER